MKQELKIKLTTIDDVKNFVNEANSKDFPIDAEREHYVVNAKSLLGLFSLDLSEPIIISTHSDTDSLDSFKCWKVK